MKKAYNRGQCIYERDSFKSSQMIIRIKQFVLSSRKLNKLGDIQRQLSRHGSSQSGTKVLECLRNRSVLCLSGKESSDFLQGLITNDMKHFEDGAANIYSLFLNIKGRVMYDTIIYKSQDNDRFYVECDSRIGNALHTHLKMYRIRRKIDIENLQDKINVWALFSPNRYPSNDAVRNETDKRKVEGLIFPCGNLNNKGSKFVDNIMIYEDPRLYELGFRILAESGIDRSEIIKHLDEDVNASDGELSYRAFRYKLGFGEGIDDLPPGKPFPLEINCDYLHGVSFHKGCYIGQELTARTHHTGVVRKRLMPFTFAKVPDQPLLYDEKIVNESGSVVGKFRGNEKQYGLGLMRISEVLNAQQLKISGIDIKVSKPMWWPQESQKETVSANGRK
ncbi:hypothetical protein KM043_001826 [Ampulex compressa]|nr:hypothetical protein KM043_001826 [Ampulex compressa]